jgi:hypothetical protein
MTEDYLKKTVSPKNKNLTKIIVAGAIFKVRAWLFNQTECIKEIRIELVSPMACCMAMLLSGVRRQTVPSYGDSNSTPSSVMRQSLDRDTI